MRPKWCTSCATCLLAASVVQDDKGATGQDGVGQEIVGSAGDTVMCGNCGKVGVRM